SQLLDEGRRLESALAPVDRHSAERIVHARGQNRQPTKSALNVVNAGGTVDAVDGEVDMGDAPRAPGDVVGGVEVGHEAKTGGAEMPLSPLTGEIAELGPSEAGPSAA